MSAKDIDRKINLCITEIINYNKKLKKAQENFRKIIQMKNSKEFQIFIKDLNLSTRVKRLLIWQNGIDNVAELLQYSCIDLLNCDKFGIGCLRELQKELGKLGFQLREK